jgi:hypothetical protein
VAAPKAVKRPASTAATTLLVGLIGRRCDRATRGQEHIELTILFSL